MTAAPVVKPKEWRIWIAWSGVWWNDHRICKTTKVVWQHHAHAPQSCACLHWLGIPPQWVSACHLKDKLEIAVCTILTTVEVHVIPWVAWKGRAWHVLQQTLQSLRQTCSHHHCALVLVGYDTCTCTTSNQPFQSGWIQIGAHRNIFELAKKPYKNEEPTTKNKITIKWYIFDCCAGRDLFRNILYQSLLLFKQINASFNVMVGVMVGVSPLDTGEKNSRNQGLNSTSLLSMHKQHPVLLEQCFHHWYRQINTSTATMVFNWN